MTQVIEVSHLTKQFGGFTAVDNISFLVKEGEVVGLLGRNGAGKTTTISMLLGLLTPTRGTIRIFGKDLETHREEILSRVNFSSAYINFPTLLSARENLGVFAMLYDIPGREEKVTEVIQLFGIEPFADIKYMYLSDGQQTRVHLAKAFLNNPRILFLDEPTAALDPDIADMVRKLILAMQKRHTMTVLLTSHNMAEVEDICDRVIFIDQGKIIAEDTPYSLAKQMTGVTINLMIKDGMKRMLEYCKKHGFSAKQDGRYITATLSESDIIYFLSFLVENGISYEEISIDRPTLEDYFLRKSRRPA
jgi:ABC-2 type transport system ATP-binding protein